MDRAAVVQKIAEAISPIYLKGDLGLPKFMYFIP
jgi:hypothetical protein